jgi:predicted esterase
VGFHANESLSLSLSPPPPPSLPLLAAANSGVFAFSQGATMAALVSLLSATPPWGFAILVAGFDPLDEGVLGKLPEAPIAIPVLSVSGSADSFVPRARTMALASRFANHASYEHPGGHGIPSNAQFRSAIKEFVALHHKSAA